MTCLKTRACLGPALLCWALTGLFPGIAQKAAAEGEAVTMGCYCVGTVGNVNCDYADRVTVGDLALLIDHLYINLPRLPNPEEANINGDTEGVIDMADVAMLIDHLFINHIELPSCPIPPNSPPETWIVGLAPDILFVDGPPGAPTAGVLVRWRGDDPVDHPYFPPPFEFEYRLYGPYSDSLFEVIQDSFLVPVFQTLTGDLLRYGRPPDTTGCDTIYDGDQIDTVICRLLGTHYITCDTSWDGGQRQVDCDTVLIDTVTNATANGRVNTLFDVENPAFNTRPELNRLAKSSYDGIDTWTGDTTDSLYSLFAGCPCDTTRLMNFVFWVRARDSDDSALHDPTPAYARLEVVDPAFERDVLVVNWTGSAHANRAYLDSTSACWDRTVNTWIDHGGSAGDVQFWPERDIVYAMNYSEGSELLELALKYKILVLTQDAAQAGGWSSQGPAYENILTAIATGAGAWVAARVPLGPVNAAYTAPPSTEYASESYRYFFGVDCAVFPGWGEGLRSGSDGYGYGRPRVEDFVGTYSENAEAWPILTVDTSLLRRRYLWAGSIDPPEPPFYPYLDSIGALPQVGWTQPTDDAEVVYRYRSLYGEVHPIYPEREFENKPVMHRLDRGLFRTVHANFTLVSLEETSAQQMVDSVLNWLYEPHAPGGVQSVGKVGQGMREVAGE